MPSPESKIEQNRRLIGMSNTFPPHGEALGHVRHILEPEVYGKTIVVIPYALHPDQAMAELEAPFKKMGAKSVLSPHSYPGSEAQVIRDNADAVYISGGNTGRLVANLHSLTHADGTRVDRGPSAAREPLVPTLYQLASEGITIMGSSAGINVMCADVRTTNDMQSAVQILEGGQRVLRIDGLGLLPTHLSINPHYIDKIELNYMGESRRERLEQILEADPQRIILALREGAFITIRGMEAALGGDTGGLVFRANQEPLPLFRGDDLSFLLDIY